jgi:hypothetical protein
MKRREFIAGVAGPAKRPVATAAAQQVSPEEGLGIDALVAVSLWASFDHGRE